MPRVVSFIVLLAIVLLIGAMFFQVMAQFIVPLFLAAVLVVIFKPLHVWLLKKLGNRPRISAILTTLAIALIVLLPIGGMFAYAVVDGIDLYERSTLSFRSEESEVIASASTSDESDLSSRTASGEPPKEDESAADEESSSVQPAKVLRLDEAIEAIVAAANDKLAGWSLPSLDASHIHTLVSETLRKVAAPIALGGVQFIVSTLFGLAIMVLTMYYIFADGPDMAAGLMKLSPLDNSYEQELLDKFGDISRAVVVAVLLSAVIQGLLAGIGYFLAGAEYVVFLTAATMFLAMVPFVGAAAVWVPVCAVLYFYMESTTAAIGLALYCLTIVSMSDNLVKPMVLHGQSNLHPLLALLSVIGGIQVLGPIGILVGPMLVAFLQALLNMLNKELLLLGKEAEGGDVSAGAADGPPNADQSEQTKPQQRSNKAAKKSRKK